MQSRAGVIVSDKVAASAAWQEPIRDGMLKHKRFIWIKRGGTASSGSGPTGWKTKPAARLARSLAERPGVALAVKQRQQAKEGRRA